MKKAIQNMWALLKNLVAIRGDLQKDIQKGEEVKIVVTEAKPPAFIVRSMKSLALAIPMATVGAVIALVMLTGTEVWKTMLLLILAFIVPIAAFIYLIMSIGDAKTIKAS